MKLPSLAVPLLAVGISTAWAAPTAYELNTTHTDVTFTISHAGFTMKHGSFVDVTGTLQLDPDHLDASSVDVTVPIKSVYTGHAKRDQDLQTPLFLDAAHFPTMHFVSTRVTVVGPSTLDVTGDLTLHGVTRQIVLHSKVNLIGKSPFGGGQTAGFTAEGALKRSDYGMKEGIPMIGDDIAIVIDAEFAVPRPRPAG
jgi:polyisoprenoid-binding protein YceI